VAAQYRGRVLILEDDPGVGNVIRAIASASGFEVRVVAESGPFFGAVDEWQPTHIVLDLVVPDMDGVQVLAELGQRACAAGIVITSGMGSRVVDAAGRSARGHGLHLLGVLAKPFSAAALRHLLASEPGALVTIARDPAAGHSAKRPEVTLANFMLALECHQFCVHYQPKIACLHGRLGGFEALVRWAHPEWGLIMPDQFVPFAERHGLINALTEAVLEESLLWFGAGLRQQQGARSRISLSINLSAISLQDATLVDRIAEYCERHGVAPERLILEVTETSAMSNPVAALDMLTRMRMRGFELSLDDFGTGYSSMLQLVRMPFSEIKIDKSFVMSAVASAESRAVVESIVDLGRSLGLKSAAEGVEDAQTLTILRAMGCDYAQGYWIGRPMNAADATAWMSD
jgi:EAL domain-containing protein (putative c-di-GMP-specific phosphodiesterase class I)/ActR/RegA family two-component response regulator